VKPDAVAQRERPHEPVLRRGPARGERRLDVGGALPPGYESVEDLTRDEGIDPLERRAGIDDRGHAGRSDAELAADRARRRRRRLRERGHGSPRDHDRHKDQEQRKLGDPVENAHADRASPAKKSDL
jgi:hypothetical protein